MATITSAELVVPRATPTFSYGADHDPPFEKIEDGATAQAAADAGEEVFVRFLGISQPVSPATNPLSGGVQPEQSADFTATAGRNGAVHEWPVDVSGLAAGETINVAQPTGTAEPGDQFAVFDSRQAAGNGSNGTTDRRIRINFTTDPLLSLPAPDFAEIDSPAARFEFKYINDTLGWRPAITR